MLVYDHRGSSTFGTLPFWLIARVNSLDVFTRGGANLESTSLCGVFAISYQPLRDSFSIHYSSWWWVSENSIVQDAQGILPSFPWPSLDKKSKQALLRLHTIFLTFFRRGYPTSNTKRVNWHYTSCTKFVLFEGSTTVALVAIGQRTHLLSFARTHYNTFASYHDPTRLRHLWAKSIYTCFLDHALVSSNCHFSCWLTNWIRYVPHSSTQTFRRNWQILEFQLYHSRPDSQVFYSNGLQFFLLTHLPRLYFDRQERPLS